MLSDVLFISSLEGALRLETPATSVTLEAGDSAFLSTARGVSLACDSDHAVIEVSLPLSEIGFLAERLSEGEVLHLDGGPPAAVVAVLNTMFNERLDLTLPGTAYRRRAVVDLIAAVAVDHFIHPDKGDRRLGRGLVREARLIIDQHFTDPKFDSTRLAGLLFLSRSQLYRAFDRVNSTPRNEILRRRLQEVAHQLNITLAEIGTQSTQALDAVAAVSGFSDRRSLARAIATLEVRTTHARRRAQDPV